MRLQSDFYLVATIRKGDQSSKMAKNEVNVVDEAKAEQNVSAKTENVSQIMKAMEATEALAAMDGTESAADEEKKIEIPKIYVVRRRYTNKSDGKQYWEYILPAVFRGSISEVHFKASDVGGYEALEKLFSTGINKVELQFHEERQWDEHTGIRKYMVYEAVVVDDMGFEWRYPLKTVRGSDKAVMENYIRLLRFEAEKAHA